MATPVASDAAVLIRQYFMSGFYPTGRRMGCMGFVQRMGACEKEVDVCYRLVAIHSTALFDTRSNPCTQTQQVQPNVWSSSQPTA